MCVTFVCVCSQALAEQQRAQQLAQQQQVGAGVTPAVPGQAQAAVPGQTGTAGVSQAAAVAAAAAVPSAAVLVSSRERVTGAGLTALGALWS